MMLLVTACDTLSATTTTLMDKRFYLEPCRSNDRQQKCSQPCFQFFSRTRLMTILDSQYDWTPASRSSRSVSSGFSRGESLLLSTVPSGRIGSLDLTTMLSCGQCVVADHLPNASFFFSRTAALARAAGAYDTYVAVLMVLLEALGSAPQ